LGYYHRRDLLEAAAMRHAAAEGSDLSHSSRYRRFLKLLKRRGFAAGMTQVQVAAALGRPQSFVAKCESGERRVDLSS